MPMPFSILPNYRQPSKLFTGQVNKVPRMLLLNDGITNAVRPVHRVSVAHPTLRTNKSTGTAWR
jgi:hypothetical protein